MAQENTMRAFMIVSERETCRKSNVQLVSNQIPGMMLQEAIYPKYQKVAFLDRIIQKSRERGGRALNKGEIGVLLSNRAIWQRICKMADNDEEHFLIMESDSTINNLALLKARGKELAEKYDLFFFGGWMGHIVLKRSTAQPIDGGFRFGEPYLRSVCSGYGYSLNRKAARYLLQRTARVQYPVDEFKEYIEPGVLKVGAIVPELISELPSPSTITHEIKNPVLLNIKMQFVYLRNKLIAYFS